MNALTAVSDFMERVGTGIERIKNACFENKNKVEFIFDTDNFFIIVKSSIIFEGANEGIDILSKFIRNNPSKRVPYFTEQLKIPMKTLERWFKFFKKDDLIEFKGSSKTGGYFVKIKNNF